MAERKGHPCCTLFYTQIAQHRNPWPWVTERTTVSCDWWCSLQLWKCSQSSVYNTHIKQISNMAYCAVLFCHSQSPDSESPFPTPVDRCRWPSLCCGCVPLSAADFSWALSLLGHHTFPCYSSLQKESYYTNHSISALHMNCTECSRKTIPEKKKSLSKTLQQRDSLEFLQFFHSFVSLFCEFFRVSYCLGQFAHSIVPLMPQLVTQCAYALTLTDNFAPLSEGQVTRALRHLHFLSYNCKQQATRTYFTES